MRKVLNLSVLVFVFSMIFVGSAFAQTTVTASNQQGWSSMAPQATTRLGGIVNFVRDPSSPAPFGALQLRTDSSTTSKAQYIHKANVPLSDITQLGYYNKTTGGPSHAAASYQLILMLCGTSGFTTMVYEPYQNGTITYGGWQSWDVDAGRMWSSQTINCGGPAAVVAGSGGAPFYTLSWLQTNFPNATVIAYGVNIGSSNPGYTVSVDLFNFNGTKYDFELYDASDCKNNGWMYLREDDDGITPFSNQGQCVSYVNSNTSQ